MNHQESCQNALLLPHHFKPLTINHASKTKNLPKKSSPTPPLSSLIGPSKDRLQQGGAGSPAPPPWTLHGLWSTKGPALRPFLHFLSAIHPPLESSLPSPISPALDSPLPPTRVQLKKSPFPRPFSYSLSLPPPEKADPTFASMRLSFMSVS